MRGTTAMREKSEKEKKRGTQGETDVWNGVVHTCLQRIWLICTALQLVSLIMYEPTEKCSRVTYLELYFLVPVIAQGLVLLLYKIYAHWQSEIVSDNTMNIMSVIFTNALVAIPVCVHSGLIYILLLLMVPICMVSLYKMEKLVWFQLVITAVLYGISRISIFPPVKYWLNEMPGLKVVTFMTMAYAFVVIEEQVRRSTQQLEIQVWKDSLTRLNNHEAFYETLEEEMEKFQEAKEPFSILIADIDNFKKVNDTYGHAYGDEVIRAVARVMEKNRGSRDFAARYGGEEFAMVMPRKGVKEAILMADKIRRDFNAVSIESTDGPKSFTISIGVAEYSRPYRTSSSFFEEADKALYEAKASGKNKVCCNKAE